MFYVRRCDVLQQKIISRVQCSWWLACQWREWRHYSLMSGQQSLTRNATVPPAYCTKNTSLKFKLLNNMELYKSTTYVGRTCTSRPIKRGGATTIFRLPDRRLPATHTCVKFNFRRRSWRHSWRNCFDKLTGVCRPEASSQDTNRISEDLIHYDCTSSIPSTFYARLLKVDPFHWIQALSLFERKARGAEGRRKLVEGFAKGLTLLWRCSTWKRARSITPSVTSRQQEMNLSRWRLMYYMRRLADNATTESRSKPSWPCNLVFANSFTWIVSAT